MVDEVDDLTAAVDTLEGRLRHALAALMDVRALLHARRMTVEDLVASAAARTVSRTVH